MFLNSHSFLKFKLSSKLSACFFATSVWRQELPGPGGHGNSSLGPELRERRQNSEVAEVGRFLKFRRD